MGDKIAQMAISRKNTISKSQFFHLNLLDNVMKQVCISTFLTIFSFKYFNRGWEKMALNSGCFELTT